MQLSHLMLVLMVVISWGLNFVIMKSGLNNLSPIFLATLRFFLASIPGIFLVKKPDVPLPIIARYGLFMFALPVVFLLTGMHQGVTSGIASLVFQLSAVFTVILSMFFFKERSNKWQTLSIVIAFAGIGLIGMHVQGNITWLGLSLVILGALSMGFGNIFSKQIGDVNMLALVIWGSLIAWPPLLITSLLLEGWPTIVYQLTHLDIKTLALIGYSTYVATLFCFGSWSYLLHHHPINSLVQFKLLVPVVGLLSSAIIFGEPIQLWKIMALVLICTGIVINIFSAQYHHKKNM